MAAVGTTSRAEESSQPGELLESLPPMSPRPGKTSTFNNLPLGVVTNIVLLVVGDIARTKTKEPLMGTGVGNILSTSDCISITIVETGSSSAPPVLIPVMDILEEFSLQIVRQFFTTMKYLELSLQIVRQFFTTMKYCSELVLSGRSSFEFVQ